MQPKKNYRRLEDTGIYVDTYELTKLMYSALFELSKKDRVVMGDMLMRHVTAMLSEFALAYRLKSERLVHIDAYLGNFEALKGLLRVALELKMVKPSRRVAIYTLVQRIDDGIIKWRNSAANANVHAGTESNYDRAHEGQKTRGGDGIIHASSGSAPE